MLTTASAVNNNNNNNNNNCNNSESSHEDVLIDDCHLHINPKHNVDPEPVHKKWGMFTVTTTRQAHSNPRLATTTTATTKDPAIQQWFSEQRAAVEAERRTQHEEFIRRHEAEAAMTESHRQIATKILCFEAIRYHTHDSRSPTPTGDCSAVTSVESNGHFEMTWWRSFWSQVSSFLSSNTSLQAMENISSLGIWFRGEGMYLPSRQYSVLALSHHVMSTHDVTIKDHESADESAQVFYTPVYVAVSVVGLCQFGYSNYVHDARMQTQRSVLKRIQPAPENSP